MVSAAYPCLLKLTAASRVLQYRVRRFEWTASPESPCGVIR